MSDEHRYIVTGSLGGHGAGSIPKMPFRSEREALIHIGKLLDEHGSRVVLEILLGDQGPALRDIKWIMDWNRNGRPLPPE